MLTKGLIILAVALIGGFAVHKLTGLAFGSDSPVPFALGVMAALPLFVGGLYWLSGRPER